MSAATIKITNSLLSKILKIVNKINSEVSLQLSKNIEIQSTDPAFSIFLSVILNRGAYTDYKKNDDFEISINFEILQHVSERSEQSRPQEISLNFSDTQMRFLEGGPNGSVFDLNIYSSTSAKRGTPKFQSINSVKSDSTLILEGLKKLSIISKFFDIFTDDGKVILHSRAAVYGEGVVDIGTSKNFSSNGDYYRILPLKDILEVVPEKTEITIDISANQALRISFIFSNVAFTIIMAASAPEK